MWTSWLHLELCLTVVMDLESGAVVFVNDGKGADALKPFNNG